QLVDPQIVRLNHVAVTRNDAHDAPPHPRLGAGPSADPTPGMMGSFGDTKEAAMRISIYGGSDATTVAEVVGRVRAAADEGFRSFWLPQTAGLDALTALAVAAHAG